MTIKEVRIKYEKERNECPISNDEYSKKYMKWVEETLSRALHFITTLSDAKITLNTEDLLAKSTVNGVDFNEVVEEFDPYKSVQQKVKCN